MSRAPISSGPATNPLVINITSGNPLIIDGTGGAATPPPGQPVLVLLTKLGIQGFEVYDWGSNARFRGGRANGTPEAPTAILNGNPLTTFTGVGWNGVAWTNPTGGNSNMVFGADEDWTEAANGSNITFSTTTTGSTSSAQRMRINNAGQLLVNKSVATTSNKLEVSGGASTDTLAVTTSSTPASAAATGVAGTITWDASFIYVCVATNTWKRVAIATW